VRLRQVGSGLVTGKVGVKVGQGLSLRTTITNLAGPPARLLALIFCSLFRTVLLHISQDAAGEKWASTTEALSPTAARFNEQVRRSKGDGRLTRSSSKKGAIQSKTGKEERGRRKIICFSRPPAVPVGSTAGIYHRG